jgi:hypothetical protein
MISIIAERLCGSIPMITYATPPLLLDQTHADVGEEGSATSSWADPSSATASPQ